MFRSPDVSRRENSLQGTLGVILAVLFLSATLITSLHQHRETSGRATATTVNTVVSYRLPLETGRKYDTATADPLIDVAHAGAACILCEYAGLVRSDSTAHQVQYHPLLTQQHRATYLAVSAAAPRRFSPRSSSRAPPALI